MIKKISYSIGSVVLLACIFCCSGSFAETEKVDIIYHEENEFGSIWIFSKYDRRCMSFKKPPSEIVQSCIYKSKPIYKNASKYTGILLGSLFLMDEPPQNILMIGLGGAVVARSLNILTPEAHLDLVEINPAIPPVVEKYFYFKPLEKDRIIIADGVEFVKDAPDNKYDLVIIDAFDENYIPKEFLTNGFMENVFRIMTDKGVVAMNSFCDTEFSSLESDLFKKHFKSYYNLITIYGTKIMIATKVMLPNIDQIFLKSKSWKTRFAELDINTRNVFSLFGKPVQ